jgi:hypothetical protein
MVKNRWFLVFFVVLISGCIEAGSLNLPSDDSKLDLSKIGSQLRNIQKTPSDGKMGVPLNSLPRHFLRSSEQGSYSEAFTLKGLPSTVILWRIIKDPYGNEFNKFKSDSDDVIELVIDSTEVEAVVVDNKEVYSVSSHIGLYTFVAETQSPEVIDRAGVYGGREEVVNKVFEAGVENALSFDLDSFGD